MDRARIAVEHADTYRHGLFEPVTQEATVSDLKVLEGEIPEELTGSFVRNGSNPRFEPRGRSHWFDGDGMVHAVSLEGGRATYRNRYVRTRAFEKETAAGKALWSGIMEPVEVSNPNGPSKDTANTDVVWHAGKLYALWWLSGEPYELSLPDFETVGPCRFGSERPVRFAAHPKVCPATGEMMVFDYSVVAPPYLRYGVIGADRNLESLIPIELPGPRLLHDIAITRRHTLFLDCPMTWDAQKLAQGKRRVTFDRELPLRIGVIPRRGKASEVRWFEARAGYVYHTINAWEEGDELVLLACRIENPLPADAVPSGKIPRLDFIELVPHLHRWRLNLVTGAVREEQLDDVLTEFPRMHDARRGERSRYSYNPRLAEAPTLLFDGVVKYDLDRGSSIERRFAPGHFSSELVFAPRPGATDEDDGWLVSLVASDGGESELSILDARDLAVRARVRVPRRVPVGFHACWVPGP